MHNLGSRWYHGASSGLSLSRSFLGACSAMAIPRTRTSDLGNGGVVTSIATDLYVSHSICTAVVQPRSRASRKSFEAFIRPPTSATLLRPGLSGCRSGGTVRPVSRAKLTSALSWPRPQRGRRRASISHSSGVQRATTNQSVRGLDDQACSRRRKGRSQTAGCQLRCGR